MTEPHRDEHDSSEIHGGEIDILVIAGPGIGHLSPIASFCASLTDPDRVAYLTAAAPGHPVHDALQRRVRSSGGQLLTWTSPTPSWSISRTLSPSRLVPVSRIMEEPRRLLTRRVVPRLAARGSATQLPNLASRSVFAFASMLRTDEECNDATLEELDAVIARLAPTLVLSDRFVDLLPAVCAHRGVSWAEYTTGPVADLSPRSSAPPAGFDPRATGSEAVANRVLQAWRRQRARRHRYRANRAASRRGMLTRSEPVARFAFSCAALDDIGAVPTSWDYAGLSPYLPPTDWRSEPSPLSERSTILVSWGSGPEGAEDEVFDLLVPTLVALADRYEVIIQSGDRAFIERLGTDPRDRLAGITVRLAGDRPDYEAYRRARLVISHGGYGTINEAVAFGAPIMVFPRIVADRMETARRVVESGVGAVVDRYTATPASLRSVIETTLVDEQVAANVATIGSDLRDPSHGDAVLQRLRSLLGA